MAIETAIIFTSFAFFMLELSLFQLTPAKHKVGEYSIIWHKNRFEIVKNMPEN